MSAVYREWDAFSELVGNQKILMEFRLVYQGILNSTGNKSASGNKHQIRRYLHRQLVNLWKINPLLRHGLSYEGGTIIHASPGMRTVFSPGCLMETYKRGGKRYLPLICPDNNLTCSLEILLLRRDLGSVLVSGDLDGRIKTLIDALAIPVIGEYAEEGDEDPLFCLMSDDKLVSEIKVTADHLFAEPDQIIENPKTGLAGEPTVNKNHVLCVIGIKTKGDPSV